MKSSLETVCRRIKLKPNSTDRVYEWARELNSRKAEALATLKDESVYIESAFLEKAQDGDYLIVYMKVANMEKAGAIAAKSKHDIDKYHQQFKKDTWEKGETLELLVDLDRLEEINK